MQEDNNLLTTSIRKKMLADQLLCVDVPVKDKDIIMTLLESLLASYKYLIDNVDEITYDGLYDDVFDTRDVEA